MGSFENGGDELLPEAWLPDEQLDGRPDAASEELELWRDDTTGYEYVDDGRTLAGYAAEEALELLRDYPANHEDGAEENPTADLEADGGDSPEKSGTVLICGGEGPWINPGLLTPDADGNTGDFSWWFNGGGARHDQQQTEQGITDIRPARNHEARTIIANQFGTSEAALEQTLSGLGIDAKTALNNWHMSGDWGEATYGERVLAGIALHVAETSTEGTHDVGAANTSSKQPTPAEPATAQPEQRQQPDLSEQRDPHWFKGIGRGGNA